MKEILGNIGNDRVTERKRISGQWEMIGRTEIGKLSIMAKYSIRRNGLKKKETIENVASQNILFPRNVNIFPFLQAMCWGEHRKCLEHEFQSKRLCSLVNGVTDALVRSPCSKAPNSIVDQGVSFCGLMNEISETSTRQYGCSEKFFVQFSLTYLLILWKECF